MKVIIQFYLYGLLLFIERLFHPRGMLLANYGPGTHVHGITTKLADAGVVASNTRFLFGMRGSDDAHVDVCGAGDAPIYLMLDTAQKVDDPVACRQLALGAGSDKAVAAGEIPFDALRVVVAGGKAAAMPGVGAGNFYVVGRAMQAAHDGDEFEFQPLDAYEVTSTS